MHSSHTPTRLRSSTELPLLTRPIRPIRPTRLAPFALLALLPFAAACARAEVNAPRAITSTQSIAQTAERAVREQAGKLAGALSLAVAPMDPRLRLPACDE